MNKPKYKDKYIETLEKHTAELREMNTALIETTRVLTERNAHLQNITKDFDTGFIFNFAYCKVMDFLGYDE